jgi:hypothetical protein
MSALEKTRPGKSPPIKTASKDTPLFGVLAACIIVGLFMAGYALGSGSVPSESQNQTARIKEGLCIAQETKMYQPPELAGRFGPIAQEPYPMTRYVCPQTEFWRAPQ